MRRDYRKQPMTEEEEQESYLWSVAHAMGVQPSKAFLTELEEFIDKARREYGSPAPAPSDGHRLVVEP